MLCIRWGTKIRDWELGNFSTRRQSVVWSSVTSCGWRYLHWGVSVAGQYHWRDRSPWCHDQWMLTQCADQCWNHCQQHTNTHADTQTHRHTDRHTHTHTRTLPTTTTTTTQTQTQTHTHTHHCSHSPAHTKFQDFCRTFKDPRERFSRTLYSPAMSKYNDKRQLLNTHNSMESVTVQSIVEWSSQVEKKLFAF